jgi:TFIIH basal transcription factor complex TTD-A subunit
MLMDIDAQHNNEYIIEVLDEEHLLVKETKVAVLKERLKAVRSATLGIIITADKLVMLKEKLKDPEEESGAEN